MSRGVRGVDAIFNSIVDKVRRMPPCPEVQELRRGAALIRARLAKLSADDLATINARVRGRPRGWVHITSTGCRDDQRFFDARSLDVVLRHLKWQSAYRSELDKWDHHQAKLELKHEGGPDE